MELFTVQTVDEAKKIIDQSFTFSAQREEVDIKYALSRILFSSIIAKENVPSFRRSTVDGYGLYSKDTFGASEAIPAILKLVGEVKMGEASTYRLNRGECVYVPTGGMLPEGSDCAAMIEHTEKLDQNTILIANPTPPQKNMVAIGEDIKINDLVLKKGRKLKPYDIGMLSSLGIKNVEVCQKIKIGIISTGDEVIDIDEEITQGKVRDVNTYLLHSLIIEAGCEPVLYGVIKDDYDLLFQTVTKGIKECDLLLISGGSSVGKKDQTVKVIKGQKNSQILTHGLAVKPGKPTIVAKCQDKVIFGLPGHPLACAVIFKILVMHCIKRFYDLTEEQYPLNCLCSIDYHKAKGREEYLPVTLEVRQNKLYARPLLVKSGLISGFAKAYGYIIIGRNLEGIKAEQQVLVYQF
ncbi:molybdopterin molybdotransferase MoeA [Bacillota bacterium LX-D]|nr:molybdopterin molybdotransferase MoeA [Bacillota bacterium LX-D]